MDVQLRRRALLVAIPVAILLMGVALERLDSLAPLRVSIQRTPASVPSSLVVPDAEIESGLALLSVYTDEASLHDPERGLLTNTVATGREWEVPATVSFFEAGQLVYAGSAGLRVHGGKSRIGSPVQSFRLHFRREYGARQFMPGVLFEGRSDPISTLVVHNDLREDRRERWWHLVNPLAYDIARQMGALTPETKPVRFLLNGEVQGAYVLTSHVREPYMQARYGYEQLATADTRTRRGLRRAIAAIRPLTMVAVDEVLDLESLTRWFMSVVFCAVTDPFQGVVFLDESEPDARWFWVNWDMDHSFMDLYRQAPRRAPWRHDTFRTTLRKARVESQVVTRLLAEDPAYRSYLARLLTEALNHQITPAFLAQRFAHYRDVAHAFEVEHTEYLEELEEFLTRRPGEIRTQLAEYAEMGPLYTVTVESAREVMLNIDGHREPTGYVGQYFAGQEVRVSLLADDPDFVGWSVNGRAVTLDEAWHRVGADTVIRAEFTRD